LGKNPVLINTTLPVGKIWVSHGNFCQSFQKVSLLGKKIGLNPIFFRKTPERGPGNSTQVGYTISSPSQGLIRWHTGATHGLRGNPLRTNLGLTVTFFLALFKVPMAAGGIWKESGPAKAMKSLPSQLIPGLSAQQYIG